jgi:glycosyltransferase involved in cell wall biosynthesis
MFWKSKQAVFVLLIVSSIAIYPDYDLTVVGPMKFADGIFRLSIGWVEHLSRELKINFISTGFLDLDNVSPSVVDVVNGRDKTPGNVAVLLDSPWHRWGRPVNFMPESTIKIAYSMLESTKIPDEWVTIFNTVFDAIVVPDEFFVQVYSDCGVKTPIFVLPIGLYLDDFLNRSPKTSASKPFKFGVSGSFFPAKNHSVVLEAFAQEFGTNRNVQLLLHGRGGDSAQLEKRIKELKLKNVNLIKKSFTHQEYINFFDSLDAYVLLSKGEGFSITPREALALGIPCIISNNTAHRTLCNTGFVRAVESNLPEPAYYEPLGGVFGNRYNCTIEDARKALRDVYNNYFIYKQKALQGRIWVMQYNYKNIIASYKTLIKPEQIILSDKNHIAPGLLTVNCKNLYEKYCFILKQKCGAVYEKI